MWSSGDGFEVCTTAVNKMRQDIGPVIARIPCDSGWSVDLDGHHLGGETTLNNNNESADTPTLATPFLAAFNVRDDKGIANVSPWDDMSGSDGESNFGQDR